MIDMLRLIASEAERGAELRGISWDTNYVKLPLFKVVAEQRVIIIIHFHKIFLSLLQSCYFEARSWQIDSHSLWNLWSVPIARKGFTFRLPEK